MDIYLFLMKRKEYNGFIECHFNILYVVLKKGLITRDRITLWIPGPVFVLPFLETATLIDIRWATRSSGMLGNGSFTIEVCTMPFETIPCHVKL